MREESKVIVIAKTISAEFVIGVREEYTNLDNTSVVHYRDCFIVGFKPIGPNQVKPFIVGYLAPFDDEMAVDFKEHQIMASKKAPEELIAEYNQKRTGIITVSDLPSGLKI